MTPIVAELWCVFLGDVPMPDNCTYWQFTAARDALWADEELQETRNRIKQLADLRDTTGSESIKQSCEQLIKQELGGISW